MWIRNLGQSFFFHKPLYQRVTRKNVFDFFYPMKNKWITGRLFHDGMGISISIAYLMRIWHYLKKVKWILFLTNLTGGGLYKWWKAKTIYSHLFRLSSQTAAVTWHKYCRYGVRSINQSIKQHPRRCFGKLIDKYFYTFNFVMKRSENKYIDVLIVLNLRHL